MKISQLWRYPVKSLQGERLESAQIGADGITGDRQWGLFDTDTGLGLTARRLPQLLFSSARLGRDGRPEITLPDGSPAADDDQLSAWLGRRVSLRWAAHLGGGRYESPGDFERETGWETYDGAYASFHDAEQAKVSIVSAATLGAWEPRRFRANVLLDGSGEDDFVGRRVRVGEAVLDVGLRIGRCVMVTRPQPGGIARDLDVLRTLHRERHGRLAVGATVSRPGWVSVGDDVSVDCPPA